MSEALHGTPSSTRDLLRELMATGASDRYAFVGQDDGVIGWGVRSRIDPGTGPSRFDRAKQALTPHADGGPGGASAAPVAFVSMTFDEDTSGSVVVVPERSIRHGEASGDDAPPPSQEPSQEPRTRTTDRPRYLGSTVRDEAWLEAVASALTEISEGTFEKVVLARDVGLWSRTPFDVDRILLDLNDRFPSCTTFAVDGLVGASPETLIARRGTRVRSRVLAGTAPRGRTPEEDVRLGADLLASGKDRHEHELALRSAVEALAPICARLEVPDAPSLVRLDNVQHLGSDLIGELEAGIAGEAPHVLDVVARLHPTAAVGGAPSEAALAAIRRLEGMSRGRYAGPVGWFDTAGDGEFAIALRCAEIRGDRARLFAGAGIVAGSLPESELMETWLKLRAMTGVLGG